jgi:hypothetical protein
MGDVLLFSPVAKTLKQLVPDRKIWLLTEESSVAQRNPYVDRVIDIKKIRGTERFVDVDLDGVYEEGGEVHIVDAYAGVFGVSVDSYTLHCHRYGRGMGMQEVEPVSVAAGSGSLL